MKYLIAGSLAAASIITLTATVYLYNRYFPDLSDHADKIKDKDRSDQLKSYISHRTDNLSDSHNEERELSLEELGLDDDILEDLIERNTVSSEVIIQRTTFHPKSADIRKEIEDRFESLKRIKEDCEINTYTSMGQKTFTVDVPEGYLLSEMDVCIMCSHGRLSFGASCTKIDNHRFEGVIYQN